MKHRPFTGIIALFAATAVYAQNQIQQQVNSIKSQPDVYFWSQYAHPNPDTARVNATRWVLIDINEGRNDKEQLQYEDVADKVKHIKMMRGNITRDFAYIKKSEVVSPMAADTSVDPANSEPRKIIEPQPAHFVPDMFVQQILQQKSFNSVYNFLRTLKADGKIALFGPLKDVDDYSSLNLIIFDLNSKEIITVLSGETQGNSRTNLTTGAADSLDNYPDDMVAVIYYIK